MSGEQPDWPRCSHDGCVGVRLSTTALCLAHAAEQAADAFDAELRRIGTEGTVDARGVAISAELLRRVLAAAPREDDRPTFRTANFGEARFQGEARFTRVRFQGDARFDKASFEGAARFGEASFDGEAGFREVRFQGDARFGRTSFKAGAGFRQASFQGRTRFIEATFQRPAWFDGASFKGGAGFGRASFQGTAGFRQTSFEGNAGFVGARFERGAWFDGAGFQGDARFGGASFQREAWFRQVDFQHTADFGETSFEDDAGFGGASFQGDAAFDDAGFQGDAGFGGASFKGGAGFGRASFQGTANFAGTSFERVTQIGPLLARQLVLDGAAFNARVQLEVAAAALWARRVQFLAGVHLRLRYASVALDDAIVSPRAILAGVPFPFPGFEQQEQQVISRWQQLLPEPREQRWRPRLVSVCRADLAGLRLVDVDLRPCRFVGTPNLDLLRIEGAPLFAPTAGWWRAQRKTLAEEQQWRAHRPGGSRRAGWYPPACQPPAFLEAEEPEVLEPARLAALYRDLRKGREDAKDEPGAADFYYGECEMRRHDPNAPRAERLVLWGYWLLSGYALRAWRALTALAVVVVLAGILFAFWGFPSAAPSFRPAAVDPSGGLVYQQQPADPPPGLGRLPGAIRFSARSATALLRGPDRALTPLGEWLETSLRFIGPLLLGLAILSVRGRVRR